MKRTIISLLLLFLIGLNVCSARTKVNPNFHKYYKGASSTTVRRTPTQPPIDVYYDSETRQVEVQCGVEGITGQVYLCDENGNVLASSPSINCVLQVPANYTGLLLISLVGDDWDGQATVAV